MRFSRLTVLAAAAALTGCVAAPLPPPAPPTVAYVQPPPVVVRPVPNPVGYGGMVRNPMVRDIQRQLRRHGYYAGPTDGIDTPQTAAAIASFQGAHRLTPDGAASPYLLSVLRNTPPGY